LLKKNGEASHRITSHHITYIPCEQLQVIPHAFTCSTINPPRNQVKDSKLHQLTTSTIPKKQFIINETAIQKRKAITTFEVSQFNRERNLPCRIRTSWDCTLGGEEETAGIATRCLSGGTATALMV
jgi:hypothetical protein